MLNITFEFVGGPNDGKVVQGRLGEASDAERHYLFSNHGKVGHRFKVASHHAVETLTRERLKQDKPHNFQRHYYVVTDRSQEGNRVWVRADYIPEAVQSSRSSS